MARFAEIAQQLNIDHIYILVDRVDEYARIYDFQRAADMLKPLIETIPLLEMRPYAFKFFLPLEMRDKLATHLRSDRFILRDYTWQESELRELLERRLLFCCDPTQVPDETERRSFVRLFEEEVRDAGTDIVTEMIQFANASPRNLLKLAKMIFDEHTRSQPILLDILKSTYQTVLGKFAAEQL